MSDIENLLKHKNLFALPKTREEEDFSTFINKIFDEYLIATEGFQGELKVVIDTNKEIIAKQCDAIKESLNYYYRGNINKAFIVFQECLYSIYPKLYTIESKYLHPDNFYRVRIGTNYRFSKENMFHIPFEMRERITSQRYSIPGLPCLYLGNTIHVCWEEMGRPDINLMHASRFDLTESNFNFLAIGTLIQTALHAINTIEKAEKGIRTTTTNYNFLRNIHQFLILWPLLACCSIKVKNTQSTFKPEYIFPQLLLQWISANPALKIQGIQYFSNRLDLSDGFHYSQMNYVIPIQEAEKQGYCSILKKRIKLTSPISWQIIDIMNDTKLADPQELKEIIIANTHRLFGSGHIELLEGSQSSYMNTKFGIMEQKLQKMKADYLI